MDFLRALNSELLLTIGLLADAGDEAMVLIRFFDQSTVDSAQAGGEISSFLARIYALFTESETVWTTLGHTDVIMKWLQMQHVISLSTSEVLTVGGPCATPQPMLRSACFRG